MSHVSAGTEGHELALSDFPCGEVIGHQSSAKWQVQREVLDRRCLNPRRGCSETWRPGVPAGCLTIPDAGINSGAYSGSSVEDRMNSVKPTSRHQIG